MGTIRRITDLQLGSIGTTKVLSISSSEILFTISSGNRAVEITNLGSVTIFYGQSNLAVNSGGILAASGSKFWDTVTDNFSMYLRLSSGGLTSQVSAQEYQGNN